MQGSGCKQEWVPAPMPSKNLLQDECVSDPVPQRPLVLENDLVTSPPSPPQGLLASLRVMLKTLP